MIKTIIILMLFSITACSTEPETREEVIDRHSNGAKKVVVSYLGNGTEEKMLNRLTYNEVGELVLNEDFEKHIVDDWVGMHPSIERKAGLQKYPLGKWKVYGGKNNNGLHIIEFTPTEMIFYASEDTSSDAEKRNVQIEYMDNLKIKVKGKNTASVAFESSTKVNISDGNPYNRFNLLR